VDFTTDGNSLLPENARTVFPGDTSGLSRGSLNVRFVLSDNGLVGQAGHHANLAFGLVEEARGHGMTTAVWANARVETELADRLDATPVFERSPYDVAPSGTMRQLASWARCASRLAADLLRAGPAADDVLFFPTARAAEVLGIALYLSRTRTPPAAICVNFMHDDFREHERGLAIWPLLYRLSFRYAHKRRTTCRLLFTSGAPGLAQALRDAGGDVRDYPMPKAYPHAVESKPVSDPPVVAYIGVPWSSKGGHLLAEIFRQMGMLDHACRVVAQQPSPNHVTHALDAPLAALAQCPYVTLLPGPLDRDAYYRMLGESDIVFMPYDPRRYRRMTSGVFAEALALGKPVVVPAGTWMSQMLEAGYGAGVIFDRFEPASIVRALGRALDEHAEMRERARRTSDAWREAQSLAAFFRQLLADLARVGIAIDSARTGRVDPA